MSTTFNTVQPPVRRTELLLAGTVLLLAGTLRMGWPAATEFKADEARLYTLALDAATGAGCHCAASARRLAFQIFR